MKEITDLNDLMEEQLRDMFDCETQLGKALTKIRDKATDQRLAMIIDDHYEKNEDRILRLKRVFNLLYQQKRGEKCDAIRAMLKEAEDIIRRSMEPEVMDAGIITALQHIIHYQIAGYGAICNYANTLGLHEVAELIHQNLEEEKKADRNLAIHAEEVVNLKAKNMQRE